MARFRRKAGELNDAASEQKAIFLLCLGLSKKKVAEQAGISPNTLTKWLKQDHFLKRLEIQANEEARMAGSQLKAALATAVQTLAELMGPNNESSVRLRASTAIVNGSLKYAELTHQVEQDLTREEVEAEIARVKQEIALTAQKAIEVQDATVLDGRPGEPPSTYPSGGTVAGDRS